jgi:pimeloyl-ACP methyl ester carboxylesterase
VAPTRGLHLTHAGIELPDGRRLTYSAAGPADGFPLLYLHGAIGSPRWRTPELDALIERTRIRYLIVNRPGFSGSDASPGRTVAQFADDVDRLADALALDRFSVVGVSAGAPYALACARTLADRIHATAIVSPLPPPSGRAHSAVRYRLPWLAFGAPVAGRYAAAAALRAVDLRGETPTRAMIEDYAVCRRGWGFDPAEVRSPVTLWHGASDKLVPVRHARRLAAQLPACTEILCARGGHFFYSQRLGEILVPLVPERRAQRQPLRIAA